MARKRRPAKKPAYGATNRAMQRALSRGRPAGGDVTDGPPGYAQRFSTAGEAGLFNIGMGTRQSPVLGIPGMSVKRAKKKKVT